MAATRTDPNGIVWTTVYDAPSFSQVHPWQGYTSGYSDAPHLFAFSESGLGDDIDTYAATHAPVTGGTGAVMNTTTTDARGIVWFVKHLTPTAVWQAYTNSARYGSPKPTMTARTESLLRAQIAAYAVGHPLLPDTTPIPGGGGSGGGGGVPTPVVNPPVARKASPAPVLAIAALAGFAVLLARRSG